MSIYSDKPAQAYLEGFYRGYTSAHKEGRPPAVIEVSGALYDAYKSELQSLQRFVSTEVEPKISWLVFKAARIVRSDAWTATGRDF